jgi:ubiquinone/menaquinone biosynthesis C-methylase UbiE
MNRKILVITISLVGLLAALGIVFYKPIVNLLVGAGTRGQALGHWRTASSSAVEAAASGEAKDYYTVWGGEAERLFVKPVGVIERLRTESILKRYVPKPPAVVYDVGGGAGVYAFPLAQQGYTVHLLDFTPLHITQATERMQKTGIQLAECAVGDARAIKAPDATADVVLYFGPLYHLQDPLDRKKALHEAYRILKPGGMFLAVAISRFSVACNFGNKNQLHDPQIVALAKDVVETGKNNNPEYKHPFFASAYFHHPDEFEKEVKDAGFKDVQLLSIEGPSWLFSSLEKIIGDQQSLEHLLSVLEATEKDRSIMGTSAHIMAIGKK